MDATPAVPRAEMPYREGLEGLERRFLALSEALSGLADLADRKHRSSVSSPRCAARSRLSVAEGRCPCCKRRASPHRA